MIKLLYRVHNNIIGIVHQLTINNFVYYIQNWIRRRNMKRKAAFEADESNLPTIKRRKTTLWHEHLKEFAKSQGNCHSIHTGQYIICACMHDLAGRAAMAENPGIFNKEASAAYKNLSQQQKEELQLRSTESTAEPATRKKVIQRGSKIFTRIKHSVYNVKIILYNSVWLGEQLSDIFR